MSGWVKIGAKCICVSVKVVEWTSCCPSEGETYTIANISFSDGKQYIGLDEIRHPDGHPAHYASHRFRPLISKTQEQDVEMFLLIASPSPLERLDRLAEELDSLYND